MLTSFCLIFCVGVYAMDEAAASASLEGLALCTWALMLNVAQFLDVLEPLQLSKQSILFLIAPRS